MILVGSFYVSKQAPAKDIPRRQGEQHPGTRRRAPGEGRSAKGKMVWKRRQGENQMWFRDAREAELIGSFQLLWILFSRTSKFF